MKPSLIVSFTSYPARIHVVPQVLESLYSQSMKPDRILLWLAEEQFPGREADLPKVLIDDAAAGKFELRWCDDLGSHKKYFYAMQEFPDDIIILVDDDTYYHPDTIKTLYGKHLDFPNCIVGIHTKIILIDDANNIVPYKKWPPRVFIDYPSIQLIPMGGCGVLYPPNSVDPCIFDKSAILSHCAFNGVICGDDLWLKAHAILSGTLTVTLENMKIAHQQIREVQASSIGTLDTTGQSQHEQILDYILERHGAYSEKTVRELLLEAKSKDLFLDRKSDIVIQNPIEVLKTRVNANVCNKTAWNTITKGTLHYYISSFCKAMSYGNAEQSKYIEQFSNVFRTVPNIDCMAKESLYIRACVEYSAILLNTLNPRDKDPEVFLQMLTNWKGFFRNYPECEREYFVGYVSFLEEMKTFSQSEYCKGKDEICQACRDAAKAAWRQLPPHYRHSHMKKNLRSILKSDKRWFRKIVFNS